MRTTRPYSMRSTAVIPTSLKVTSGASGFKVMDPFDWTKDKAIYQRWQMWSEKARHALEAMEGDSEKTKISYFHHWIGGEGMGKIESWKNKKILISQEEYDRLEDKEGKYSSEKIENYFTLFESLLALQSNPLLAVEELHFAKQGSMDSGEFHAHVVKIAKRCRFPCTKHAAYDHRQNKGKSNKSKQASGKNQGQNNSGAQGSSNSSHQSRKPPGMEGKCMRCGKPDHQLGQKCPAKNAKCKDFHKIGHFHKVCQTNKRAREPILFKHHPRMMMTPTLIKMESDNQIHQGKMCLSLVNDIEATRGTQGNTSNFPSPNILRDPTNTT